MSTRTFRSQDPDEAEEDIPAAPRLPWASADAAGPPGVSDLQTAADSRRAQSAG